MSYFPFFVDIKGWLCVIGGGGKVAYRKVCGLLAFGADLHVIATAFIPEFEHLGNQSGRLRRSCREFQEEDLRGADLVIAASDDEGLNQRISVFCRQAHIPVNSASGKEDSSFLFPALITEGPVTIGISTGGNSPALAHFLKERIQGVLPEEIGETAQELGKLREIFQKQYPDSPALRRSLSGTLAEESLKTGKIPDECALIEAQNLMNKKTDKRTNTT